MERNQNPELFKRIEDSLEQLRPYLVADGGDVALASIGDDFVVRLKLLGACSNCSMSYMTLKAGIEQAILKAAPEIKGVESLSEDAFEAQKLQDGLG